MLFDFSLLRTWLFRQQFAHMLTMTTTISLRGGSNFVSHLKFFLVAMPCLVRSLPSFQSWPLNYIIPHDFANCSSNISTLPWPQWRFVTSVIYLQYAKSLSLENITISCVNSSFFKIWRQTGHLHVIDDMFDTTCTCLQWPALDCLSSSADISFVSEYFAEIWRLFMKCSTNFWLFKVYEMLRFELYQSANISFISYSQYLGRKLKKFHLRKARWWFKI